MKKVFLLLAVATSALLTFHSCSKGGGVDLNKIKTAKFTIQVNGLEQNDYASFILSSGATTGKNTVWKVDGTVREDEPLVSLDEDALISGKVFVIETTQSVIAISAGYQFTNGDNDAHSPITFSYKAEINGSVVKDIKNQPIAAASQLNQNYSYTE